MSDENTRDEGKKQLGSNPKDLIGAKKPRLSLVPPSSIIYQALAMQNGADKYGPYNWRSNKVIASIYLDAAMRHLQCFLDGEQNAPDSGVPHLAHALASIGIIVDALETGNLIDDRPVRGSASAMLDRFTKKPAIIETIRNEVSQEQNKTFAQQRQPPSPLLGILGPMMQAAAAQAKLKTEAELEKKLNGGGS